MKKLNMCWNVINFIQNDLSLLRLLFGKMHRYSLCKKHISTGLLTKRPWAFSIIYMGKAT